MVVFESFGMLQKFVHFDDRDGELVVIEQFLLIIKLNLVAIFFGQSPRESVSKQWLMVEKPHP